MRQVMGLIDAVFYELHHDYKVNKSFGWRATSGSGWWLHLARLYKLDLSEMTSSTQILVRKMTYAFLPEGDEIENGSFLLHSAKTVIYLTDRR